MYTQMTSAYYHTHIYILYTHSQLGTLIDSQINPDNLLSE